MIMTKSHYHQGIPWAKNNIVGHYFVIHLVLITSVPKIKKKGSISNALMSLYPFLVKDP